MTEEIKIKKLSQNEDQIREEYLIAKASAQGREYLSKKIKECTDEEQRYNLIYIFLNNLGFFDLADMQDLNNLVSTTLGERHSLLSIAAPSNSNLLNTLLTQIESHKLTVTFDNYLEAASKALESKAFENFRHIHSTFSKSDEINTGTYFTFILSLLTHTAKTDDVNAFACLYSEFMAQIAFDEDKFKKFKTFVENITEAAFRWNAPNIILFIIEKNPSLDEFINNQLDIHHDNTLLAWALNFPKKPGLLQKLIGTQPEKSIRKFALTILDSDFHKLSIIIQQLPNLAKNENFVCNLLERIFYDHDEEKPSFSKNPPNILLLLEILNADIITLDNSLKKSKEFSLLELAAKYNQVNALQKFLPNEFTLQDLLNPLKTAILYGNPEAIEFLLFQTKKIIRQTTDSKSENHSNSFYLEIISALAQSPMQPENMTHFFKKIISQLQDTHALTFDFLNHVILSTEDLTLEQLNFFLKSLFEISPKEKFQETITAMIIKGAQPGQDIYLRCLLLPPSTLSIMQLNDLMQVAIGIDVIQWLSQLNDPNIFDRVICALSASQDGYKHLNTIALKLIETGQDDKLEMFLLTLKATPEDQKEGKSAAKITKPLIKEIISHALNNQNVNSLTSLTNADLNLPLDTLDSLFLEVIAEKSTDMNKFDNFTPFYTPWLWAVEAGLKRTVAWCLEHKKAPIPESHAKSMLYVDILEELAEESDTDILKMLIESRQINDTQAKQLTITATRVRNINLLTLLLQTYSAHDLNHFIEPPSEFKDSAHHFQKFEEERTPDFLLRLAIDTNNSEFLKLVITRTKNFAENFNVYTGSQTGTTLFSQALKKPQAFQVLLDVPTFNIKEFHKTAFLNLAAQDGVPETFNRLFNALKTEKDLKKSDGHIDLASELNVEKYIFSALKSDNWGMLVSFLAPPVSFPHDKLNEFVLKFSKLTLVDTLLKNADETILEKYISTLGQSHLNRVKVAYPNISPGCMRVLLQKQVDIPLHDIFRGMENKPDKSARMHILLSQFNLTLMELTKPQELAQLDIDTRIKTYYFLAFCYANSAAQRITTLENAIVNFSKAMEYANLANQMSKNTLLLPAAARFKVFFHQVLSVGICTYLTKYTEIDQSLKNQSPDEVKSKTLLNDKKSLGAEIRKMLLTCGITNKKNLNEFKTVFQKLLQGSKDGDTNIRVMNNLDGLFKSIINEFKSRYFFDWHNSGSIRAASNTVNEFLDVQPTHFPLIEQESNQFILEYRKNFLEKISLQAAKNTFFIPIKIFAALESLILTSTNPEISSLADADEIFGEKIVFAIDELSHPTLRESVPTLKNCIATVIQDHISEKQLFNDILGRAFKEIIPTQKQTPIDNQFKKALLNLLMNYYSFKPTHHLRVTENQQYLIENIKTFLSACHCGEDNNPDKKTKNIAIYYQGTAIFPHRKELKDIFKLHLINADLALQQAATSSSQTDVKKKRKHSSTTSLNENMPAPPSSPVRLQLTNNSSRKRKLENQSTTQKGQERIFH
ncbi:MAG TPA: hypothetical protein VHE99_10015 [Gammaproteobacteria bacterium]|nr:hypothetical protein [Gammaproteobacteria bacterium]